MKEVRVVGARKMINMPPGTLFIPVDIGYNIDKFLSLVSINIK